MAAFRKRVIIMDARRVMENSFIVERGQQLPVDAQKDWIVNNKDGTSYALFDSDFRDTYDAADAKGAALLAGDKSEAIAQFKKRPLMVEARPAIEDGFVEERGQRLPFYAGKDWLVTDKNGKTCTMSDAEFRAKYDPVDEGAANLLAASIVSPQKPVLDEKTGYKNNIHPSVG